MIVPIIMAIWFGYRARKAARSIVRWAIAGAVLAFVANTVVANLGILIVSGSLTGRIPIEKYFTIRMVSIVISIIVMLFTGVRLLPASGTKRVES